ncbi:unnamed protein product [Amaranthus hypochondriacus]
MATESVLAKLMCFDKPSVSHTTNQRKRILSENYFKNMASVTNRKKMLPFSDDADIDVDFDDDLSCRTENSLHTGTSSSLPSSTFSDQKRNNLFSNGMYVQERRMGTSLLSSRSSFSNQPRKKSLSDGMRFEEKRVSCLSFDSIKSLNQSSLVSRQIAKQVTGQVKHSMWHSFAELSSCRTRTEKSLRNEEEKSSTSYIYSLNSEKKPQNLAKHVSERWRKRNFFQEERTSHRGKTRDEVFVTSIKGRNYVPDTRDGNFSKVFYTSYMNGWPVLGARYLSKPSLYPSAWIPNSRARQFSLDRNWCLRPGEWVSKQCNDTHRPNNQQEASVTFIDSDKLVKQSSCEESFTPSESLGRCSEVMDALNPSYHESHNILVKTEARDLHRDESQDSKVDSLFRMCNLAPLSLESKDITDEENEKMYTCIKLMKDNLSGDAESCKNKMFDQSYSYEQPCSPVSSLEGPEGCSHVLNTTAEAEEHLSVSACFENDDEVYVGLQRKLQVIDTMSLESFSEGPEMVVSSDEGDNRSSVGFYQNDPQISEICQTLVKECWDFSYVVDIVGEYGFQTNNLEEMDPLDPSVFDSLEKKYGKSMLWERSERRLLFDRLNLGLIESVKTSADLHTWRKPLAKRFRTSQKRQKVEDVLWSILTNQQEELKRDSSDKVCRSEMEWLDLEEDVDLIVVELERFLVDELIDEFVCM